MTRTLSLSGVNLPAERWGVIEIILGIHAFRLPDRVPTDEAIRWSTDPEIAVLSLYDLLLPLLQETPEFWLARNPNPDQTIGELRIEFLFGGHRYLVCEIDPPEVLPSL